jgi:metal-dependent HD superfamily phosphatase/phosphodiesterase
MVTVSPRLILSHLGDARVKRVYELLESDPEVQGYLRMSNKMVVERLHYNDHGPVHARITAGCSLEILSLLGRVIEPTMLTNHISDREGARIVTMMGSYLHDVGNAVHRDQHVMHSCMLAAPILERILREAYPDDPEQALRLKTETLHCIYAHEEPVKALSVEAGAAKIGDGCDMAEGRARVPYQTGRVDMHSISATSIKRVDIETGADMPVVIKVHMNNPAGVYQIEEVIGRKIATSGLHQVVDIVALENGKEIKVA